MSTAREVPEKVAETKDELLAQLEAAPLADEVFANGVADGGAPDNVRQLRVVDGGHGGCDAVGGKSGAPAGGLPAIGIGVGQMRDVTEEVIAALVAANNPPKLFERAGNLARVAVDEQGAPAVQPLGEDEVKHDMTRAADFYRFNAKGETLHANPPGVIAKDILASRSRPFPALSGVTETPFVRPDGTIRHAPGYDPLTGFYFCPPPGFSMPAVPDSPSGSDVTEALDLLMEAIGEFPYDSESSRANALALLLTPILRQAIGGPAPLMLIEKPQPGTGGSLLAEVASIIATGRAAEMLGAPDSDEEWRKQITAKLLAGATVITVDNVDGPLYAPSLSRALTARIWSDRVLGYSRNVTVAQNATWIATGNNVILRGDLPRRCVSTRLDARTSRPWQRDGFRHPHLTSWVEEHRGELVRALLVLARAWWAAGKPEAQGLARLGGYEGWVTTIGGILAHAGVPGFLTNLETLYRKSAQGDAEWEAFYAAWFDALGGTATTVGALTDEIEKDDDLKTSVPPYLAEALDRSRGSFVRKLGNALSKNEGKRYGDDNLHVVRAGELRRAVTWKLERGSASCELASLVSSHDPDVEKIEGEAEETKSRGGRTNSQNSLTHLPAEEGSRNPDEEPSGEGSPPPEPSVPDDPPERDLSELKRRAAAALEQRRRERGEGL